MARTPQSQQWPPYPHIPIYTGTSNNSGTARSYRSISPIVPSPEILVENQSIQYMAATSTQRTNMPPNHSPVSPATQFTNLSPIWSIPEPLLVPPPEVAQQPPSRPTLHFFHSSQHRVPLETPIIRKSENAEKSPPHPGRKSRLGLGIQDMSSPQSPASIPSSDAAVDKRSSNIAQRIEEGLWRYSLSGNVIKRWLLEILCWLLSALSMATIIGFLIYYRNKKIPNWPGSLTLNAFIAVLSKVSGAALILPVSEALGQLKWSWFQGHSKTMWDFEIFDNASRGPWGSFLLLIRTKVKALAALGAIITLFSLALDPFFQQVVDFPDRWTLQGHSSISRAIRYNPKTELVNRAGGLVNQVDQNIFYVARQFFYGNGTQPVPFGNGTRPEIPVSCPTGNCTWPPYQSLSVCSKCADVSNLLTFTCLNTTVDWTANLNGGDYKEKKTYPNGTMCGYFFNIPGSPNPPMMMSGYLTEAVKSAGGAAPKGEALLTRLLPLATNPEKLPLFNGSIHFNNVRNPIIDFIVVSTLNGYEGVLRNDTPVAHECVLSWCVKTFKSTYYQAKYEEEVLEIFENNTVGDFPWVSTPVITPTFNATDVWYSENITIKAPLTVNGSDMTDFGLINTTLWNVAQGFDDLFPSLYTTTNTSTSPVLRYRTNLSGASYLMSLDFNPWYGSNNITRHLERMATALTNVVRSAPNGPEVIGDAFFTETYVSVRWAWLSLPLGLLLLSLVFLIATMKKTAKEVVWKTSAIATLMYGLPDDMQKKITAEAQNRTPRAKAKELKVKLHGNGWRVSSPFPSPRATKSRQYQPPPGWF
ncbi:hypothetical protein P280DRAFT_271603 [Massarina eburnea CBS 473.64]|uniref:DUF3176 domain-containing protein n=1 Tax=Massarina eburnea CBS 473.64 TaxID=1395130 RepID=A0A6A6S4Y4_9PLEO|nr:hypothetical protein P280DRAFT_271603 [Massarina eburnea CBS 473.64]